MSEKKSNRLINSNSPYLLQHAHNPVDWYPWGEEAFDKAKQEDKPIFLSVGYASCHWCHVMERESFEDEAVAAILNQNFISIKVDREERPDIDEIYMQTVVAMTGSGGWPMSVFLTPEGKPFYGGTYFPPQRAHGLPSFREVLLAVARAWKEEREKIIEMGEQFSNWLHQHYLPPHDFSPPDDKTIHQAMLVLAQTYDWDFGGWCRAPKFPQSIAIEFLLRRASRGDRLALEIATHALKAMAQGGMYDVIGGGFSRYSTDDRWFIPHFEKMLYDNALLAVDYIHAYALSGDEFFYQIASKTLEFLIRELSNDEGGFFSSMDADSEGEEGKYYLWTLPEIHQVLDIEQGKEIFLAAYIPENVDPSKKIVLRRILDDSSLSQRFGIDEEKIKTMLSRSRQRLLDYRSSRPKPNIDDKIILSWNAFALNAFVEAYKYLKKQTYRDIALRHGNFLLQIINRQGMFHSWRRGNLASHAFLEDYASFILALLNLYQIDPNLEWFQCAYTLTEEMISLFWSEDEKIFYETNQKHKHLLVRPIRVEDTPTPSGIALAIEVLLLISDYIERADRKKIATNLISSFQESMKKHPLFFCYWLCATDRFLSSPTQIALLGDLSNQQTQEFIHIMWKTYRPYLSLASSNFPPPKDAPTILRERSLINNQPTVYICRNFVCLQPINKPAQLETYLNQG